MGRRGTDNGQAWLLPENLQIETGRNEKDMQRNSGQLFKSLVI